MTRSIAHQSVEELGGRGSVLVRQRRDHVELDTLIRRIEITFGVEQEDLLNDLCRLVFPHAFAEEAVLWPLIRRRIPEGENLTTRIEREHQSINELFTRFEVTPKSDPARKALLESIFGLLRRDVRDEEDELLPMLRSLMTDSQLARAGALWEAVRRIAPTRPHPVVARRPPGNAAAAVPLTVIDRSRDRLDHLARHASAKIARPSRALSRALTTAAGLIEHIPPLTRGEDPSTKTTGHPR